MSTNSIIDRALRNDESKYCKMVVAKRVKLFTLQLFTVGIGASVENALESNENTVVLDAGECDSIREKVGDPSFQKFKFRTNYEWQQRGMADSSFPDDIAFNAIEQ